MKAKFRLYPHVSSIYYCEPINQTAKHMCDIIYWQDFAKYTTYNLSVVRLYPRKKNYANKFTPYKYRI